MTDQDFLEWPFFEQQHRDLYRALESWSDTGFPEIDESDELAATRSIVASLAEVGWLKYSVPAPYGGLLKRLDVRSLCLVRQFLAYHSGLADFAFGMQGLGSGPISLFGNENMRKRVLPKVAKGEFVAAFALSEDEAGSDPAALQTTARRDGDDFILDGTKCWISNAGVADFYIVFAKTSNEPGSRGLSAFLVEADNPGLTCIEQTQITSPHPVGTIRLSDCRIPTESLIAEEGSGFKVAMATLDVFRSTVGAAAIGFGRRAFDHALSHCFEREVFGQKLKDFQLSQAKFADAAVALDASALLVYRAAWLKDSRQARVTKEASMAKLFATESSQVVIDSALQLLGGRGVVRDSLLERLYRDIRPLRIYEGASEIQKVIIANQEYRKYSEREQR